jgi:hypothetical protein
VLLAAFAGQAEARDHVLGDQSPGAETQSEVVDGDEEFAARAVIAAVGAGVGARSAGGSFTSRPGSTRSTSAAGAPRRSFAYTVGSSTECFSVYAYQPKAAPTRTTPALAAVPRPTATRRRAYVNGARAGRAGPTAVCCSGT